ncbi:glycosyltransferase involved in cell wall biosynthesis/O-antigen/teichoic acid export membrane protein [Streptacidiphilus sp. EB129]
MTGSQAAAPVSASAAHRSDDVTAVHGARWFATAYVAVGALNYGYALVLTRLLSPAMFARFAAGQSLILCASAVSVVAVPWVLAQALARASSERERDDAVRFAIVTSTVGGVIAGAAIGAIAAQFANLATALVMAVSTLLIYVTRVTVGWLQGNERMRLLAGVAVSEAAVKVAVGVLLVIGAGLGDAGALAAFGVGVLPYLLYWPRRGRGSARWSHALTAHHDLWRRALRIASLQGLVAVMAALDLVLVAILPARATDAAGYQASVTIGRTPLFLAAAVAMAFFPALSRRRTGTPLAAAAVRMYTTVSLPVTAVCATVPAALITAAFPRGYATMTDLMAYTAVSGFAIGGISLAVLFFQAVDDYSIRHAQAVGILLYATALMVGWRAGGVQGLAAGAAYGSLAALAVVLTTLVRRQGIGILSRVPLLEPLLLAGALILLRPYPLLWLVGAFAVGVRAIWRFLRQRVMPQASEGATRKRVVISGYDSSQNPNYRGGGAVVIDRIARRLSQEYAVTVVTAGRRGGTCVQDGVEYRRLPVCWAGPRAGQLLFQALLPLMVRRMGQHLWLESFTPPFSTGFLPLFSPTPVIGIDQIRSGKAMWQKYRLPFFLIERLGFRLYRDLVVLNEADRTDLRRYSPRACVHVIPNGVETRPVDAERFGEGRHILYLGRIEMWQKGLDLLLAAYAQATPGLPLVLAGAGTRSEEQRLREILAQAGPDVRWLGHVSGEDKDALLRDSAFVVMPSRHETFGLVALEGMAHGKPVLHFDLSCLRWMEGGGSVDVTPFDVDALASRIRWLADDDTARRKLGREAYLTSQRYSWETMTSRYLDLARTTLGAHDET